MRTVGVIYHGIKLSGGNISRCIYSGLEINRRPVTWPVMSFHEDSRHMMRTVYDVVRYHKSCCQCRRYLRAEPDRIAVFHINFVENL